MSWIHECLHVHQTCPNDTTASLPSRVVDVGAPDDSEDPRLYISKGEKSSYAALSYCWGEPQLMYLTTSNVDSLTQGTDMSKLPQTIQDAIKSVRRPVSLGRYIMHHARFAIRQRRRNRQNGAIL